MRNKLVFKLLDPTITKWDEYNSCQVKKVISICQTLGVQVYDHFNEEKLTYKAEPGINEEIVRKISKDKKTSTE